MKSTKKFIAVFMAAIMAFSVLAVSAFADDSVSAKFLNINVAGLPDFKALIGQGGTDVEGNQAKIAAKICETGADVVAVQEDFNYHSNLVANLSGYNYMTKHSGSVPGGDGLNVYTKNSPIYDATRTQWNKSAGGIAEGDSLTPKGVLYTVLDMGNGIYVDFYDLHADAFDGDDSALARVDNYTQVLNLISKNSADRPVIITGDFNTSVHIKNQGDNGADEVMMQKITSEYGFTDAWIELNNNGDYEDFSDWYKSGVSYWGNWDSVEKYYYRNGGGVEITASDCSYVALLDDNGVNLSDHNGIVCTFTFTKGDNFSEDTRNHSVNEPSDISIFMNKIMWIFKDLMFVFSNWDELMSLAGLK